MIRPLASPAIYWLASPYDVDTVQRASSTSELGAPVVPIFVAMRMEGGVQKLSVMYLAAADDVPIPSTEVQALVLLSRRDVLNIVREPVTLAQFRRSGGRVIQRMPLPTDILLEPFLQLRALAVLLQREPGLLPGLL